MADDRESEGPIAGAVGAPTGPSVAAGQGVGDPMQAPTSRADPGAGAADPAADVDKGLAVSQAAVVPLQPRWLRPAIVFTVALAHAGTLTALAYLHSQSPPAVETIEATVIAAGDELPVNSPAAHASEPASEPASESKPNPPPEQADAQPTPAPPAAEEPPAPPPDPAPPVAAAADPAPPAPADPPPQVETPPPPWPPDPPPPDPAAEASAPPVVARVEEPPAAVERQLETAPPPPPRVEKPPRPKPEARPPVERVKAALDRQKPRNAAPKTSASRADAAASRPEASEAHRVGTASGQPVDTGASRASYAALVVAEIQAHRFYPASAREHGDQGAVGVSFTIGPSGRVAAASIVRPSGFAELDEAARQIVRSIAPPPPPGGSFTASTTIRFHVE